MGCHSRKSVVVAESRTLDEEDSLPAARNWVARVAMLNWEISKSSAGWRYTPAVRAVIGISPLDSFSGGATSKAKAASVFCGDPLHRAAIVPPPEPTNLSRLSGSLLVAKAAASAGTEISLMRRLTVPLSSAATRVLVLVFGGGEFSQFTRSASPTALPPSRCACRLESLRWAGLASY